MIDPSLYYPTVRALVRRSSWGLSEADIDDIVQAAMLRAWRRRDSFEGRSSPETWVVAIALNTMRNYVKLRHLESLGDWDAPSGDDPASEYEVERLCCEIEKSEILVALAEHDRYEDIAKALGIPVGTVRSRIHRARTTVLC